jgi:TonB-linked SusC/RagA family outer membrane protein
MHIPILKSKKFSILLFTYIFLFASVLTAQSQTLSGTVTDSLTNEGIAGASIKVKNASKGVITDSRGTFKINVSQGEVLEISSIGYKALEIKADLNEPLQIKLIAVNKALTDVVVVGYGTAKRSDITGSITSVPKERLAQLPVTNILQAIEGSAAGVNVTESSSVPGSSPTALIRGVNSISASTSPLIVVDGIPFNGGSLNDINTADIASIEILKDVSAVAIYGTRGSNGIILVTTKRGKLGKAVISYNVYAGVEDFAHTMKPMSPDQYVQKYADWKEEAGSTDLSKLPNAYEQNNYAAGKTTDWLNKISQKGFIQDHTLSFSGGNKDVKYYISGDYLNQKGVIKGYQYNRASIRSNIDATITDYLKAGVNLFLTANNSDGGRASLADASTISPYGTFTNADGSYTIYPMFPETTLSNPMLNLTTTRNERSKNINSSAYIELRPGFIKGLKYRANVAYSYIPTLFQSYAGRPANNLVGMAQVNNSEIKNWVIENIVTYEKSWNKNHLDLTGLYSAQETNFFSSGTTASGFINDVLSFYNLSSAATVSGTSYAYKTNLISQMLRINYSYNSRYLFTATARRDGYSAFGAKTDKYGLFPSVALGWNISNENFMKNIKFINNLKLRGSYGLSGNQAINPNATTSTSSTVVLPFNGLSTVGIVSSVLGNENLKWESTYGSNVGIDFAIFGNRISGTIEVYNTKTKNLLLYRSLPTVTGYSNVLDNLGKVSNKGFEFSLTTKNISNGEFKWETSVNFSTNSNKIIDLYGDKKDDVGNRWFIGKPVNVVYDYKLQGVWQVGENPANQDPVANPGDLKFADLNGSKTITADDRSVIGQTTPKWTGGMTNTFH